jgi:hypothetical protein
MSVRVAAALAVLPTLLFAVSCSDDGGPSNPVDPVSIQTESLADAIEGQEYSQALAASGGSGAYSWVLAAGSLPAGLTLAPAGTISGTPAAPGTSSFRIRATDAAGQTATADLSISVIQALAVHTATLPDAVVDEDYAAQLQAVGGRGTYTWSVTGGEAASWLTVSSDGTLAGTPVASGASSVTLAVVDESGQQATRQLPIVILEPLAVAAIELPTATQGRDYAVQLVATGGDGAYTWTVESGTLPMGVALTGGGALTGAPADGGTFTFIAQVTDGADRVATRSLSLTVDPAPTIQTGSLPPGDVGVPYAAQLMATGGTGSYTWSVTGGELPDGLTLSASGAVSGTPTTLGSATFTVQVVDEASSTHTRTFTIVVAEIGTLTSGVPVTGLAGDAGSTRYYGIEVPAGATRLTVSISGGTGDVDLYVRHGALPAEFAYDCRPLREGNMETCTFTPPSAGHWYVMLRGHSDYASVSLVATFEQ